MRPVIIEARLNEYASRVDNVHVPWLVDEIVSDAIACASAGAAIAHFHPRTAQGAPAHDYDSYHAIARQIRQASDVLIHPTLGMQAAQADPRARLDPILRLAADGLAPDLTPLDMLSTNVDSIDPVNGKFRSHDSLYVNTTGTLRYFAQTLRQAGVVPYTQLWNLPSLRQLCAFHAAGYITGPAVASLVMTEGGMIAAHPGSPAGLRAYLDMLPPDTGLVWTAMIHGGNLMDLLEQVLSAGGHLALGLGDYSHPELGYPNNADLITHVAKRVQALGYTVATPQEARMLIAKSRLAVGPAAAPSA